MTRAAAAPGVAGLRYFRDRAESMRRDLVFDRAFGNKEAGANECFVADPFVAGRIAVLANRRQQRFAGEFRTVFSAGFEIGEVAFQFVGILADDGGFGGWNIHDPLSQQ